MTDPLDGWSPGTARSLSTRFAEEEQALREYGVDASSVHAPHAGLEWMRGFDYHSSKLSLSSKLITDQEWSVGRASMVIFKGTMDLTAAQGMVDEGWHPVECRIGGVSKALASIWVNRLEDSVCGAYHEYVVSIDVAKEPQFVAFDDAKVDAPYAAWYNNFTGSVCDAQYLHSLYINSPLSIAWGREMQAFPKHPKPVQSEIDIGGDIKTCAIRWNDRVIFQASTKTNFGVLGLVKQGLGLIQSVGVTPVLQFLASSSWSPHIAMPKLTAEQNKVGTDYTAHIWKGLSPMAVQVWPWNPATDTMELGEVEEPTGCESHNGIAKLKQAGFAPLSVCYLSQVSAVVTKREVAATEG